MTTLFISDLHLSEQQPEIGEQLAEFLRGPALDTDALYILGDLFEVWVGDDDPAPLATTTQALLAEFSRQGPRCFYMHGNRDFLIGAEFAERTGFEILADPVVHTIEGTRVLLSHGDAYCTDDVEYQAVRQMVRAPEWQAQVLTLPIEQRRMMASDARSESTAANASKSMEIMDVNQNAIETAMIEHDVTTLLHGHTHRPAIHDVALSNGSMGRRIVLGDWYDQGSAGYWDDNGFELRTLDRA